MSRAIMLSTAGFALVEHRARPSSESRSTPSTSWVRSLEPIEKPSKSAANSSARIALAGISAIT